MANTFSLMSSGQSSLGKLFEASVKTPGWQQNYTNYLLEQVGFLS